MPVRTDKLLIDSSCLFVGWDGSKKGKTFHYLYIPLKFISWPELFNQENYLKTIYPNTPHLEAQSTLLYILNFRWSNWKVDWAILIMHFHSSWKTGLEDLKHLFFMTWFSNKSLICHLRLTLKQGPRPHTQIKSTKKRGF